MIETCLAGTMYNSQRLAELIKSEALQFGDFTLASGKSDLLPRLSQAHSRWRSRELDRAGILDAVQHDLPNCVGGMAIGADPITAAVITCGWQRGLALKGFIVRKEAKQHGTGRQVEGPVRPGQRALLVEDVITTGGSSLTAIQHARDFGLTVDRLIAIVDRGENSSQVFADVGVEFSSLFHVRDLGV